MSTGCPGRSTPLGGGGGVAACGFDLVCSQASNSVPVTALTSNSIVL